MKIIKADQRFHSDKSEINSHFLFSFGDYIDHSNMNLGHIRIFNDDFIAPKAGFPTHEHKYYEIMTVVLNGGEITHEDSLGNKETFGKNQIQVMNTAGGVEHSEMNLSDKEVDLYQLWFAPGKQSMQPNYYIKDFKAKDFKNNLVTLGTGLEGEGGDNTLASPVKVQRGSFDAGQKLAIPYEKHILVYMTSGAAKVGERVLEKKDQLLDSFGGTINIEFTEASEVFIIIAL